MSLSRRILLSLYPGKDSFTAEEEAFAERALGIAVQMVGKMGRPFREVPVGGVFERNGVRYECFARPPADEIVGNGCSGCAFDRLKVCAAPRCSKFDRPDGVSVWFRRVE